MVDLPDLNTKSGALQALGLMTLINTGMLDAWEALNEAASTDKCDSESNHARHNELVDKAFRILGELLGKETG